MDFFDLNIAGSDSHQQFINWTVDNNGAYDYAADTRGYTIATVVEYRDRDWALRWGEAVMPKVANGIEYDWHLSQAHGDNIEFELDRGIIPGLAGMLRLLGYVNHANMGVIERRSTRSPEDGTPYSTSRHIGVPGARRRASA